MSRCPNCIPYSAVNEHIAKLHICEKHAAEIFKLTPGTSLKSRGALPMYACGGVHAPGTCAVYSPLASCSCNADKVTRGFGMSVRQCLPLIPIFFSAAASRCYVAHAQAIRTNCAHCHNPSTSAAFRCIVHAIFENAFALSEYPV